MERWGSLPGLAPSEPSTKESSQVLLQSSARLAVSTRTVNKLPFNEGNEGTSIDQRFSACRQGMRLVGLVASIDPDRGGVPESVVLARGGGASASS